jgi:TonB family protein
MDEGTADLLSSLEELHSSLPGGAEGGESSEWTSSGLTEDVTLNTEQPRTEAPTPEEEASLDDVVEQLTGSAEHSAPQPAAGTPEAEHAEAPAADEAGSAGAEPAEEKQPDPPPRRKRRISLGWLMSFFIGLVSVGVSGSLLWFGEGETGPPASPSNAVASIAAEDDADRAYGSDAPGPAGAFEKDASERAGRATRAAEERSIRRIPGNEGSEPPDELDSTPALEVASRDEEVVGESGDVEPAAPPRPRPTPARASMGGDAPADGGSAAPAAIRPEPRPASASSSEEGSAAAADGDGSDAGAEQADRAAAGGEQPSPDAAIRNAAEPGPARTRSAAEGDSGDAGPAQEPPEPSRAGGDSGRTQPIPIVGLRDLDRPLELIESPTPRLAPEAEEKGISGRVFVNLLIGPDGKVRDVRVMINPGYGLGEAAREAASRWSYTVPTRHGRPVRVWKTEVVEFETAGS